MSDPLRAMAAPSLFPLDGELRLPGLEAAVTVERDRWGTPRITAASLEDLWFAQGVVTAGERLFQLELFLRAATGTLSEIFGELTYDDDVFTRTIGLNRAGARHAAETWTDADHEMHGRFRAGVRTWIDAMPAKPIEYQLLDLEPALPDDAAAYASAFALLAWELSNNWEAELLRAELDDRLGRAVTDTLLPIAPAGGGVGSNNWVIAGRRTASGAPLLANDPHLQVTQPGIWLELVLRAPGYEARGVAVPFTPGIFLGTTPHHAWGATNVTGDVADLYEERLHEDGTAVRTAEGWAPLTIHEERIAVRGEPEPRTLAVRRERARTDPDPRDRRLPAHAVPTARSHLRPALGRPRRHAATVARDRGGAGRRLRGVPLGDPAGRLCRAELRLRRRGRAYRLPVHRTAPGAGDWATARGRCRAGTASTSGSGGSPPRTSRGRSIRKAACSPPPTTTSSRPATRT